MNHPGQNVRGARLYTNTLLTVLVGLLGYISLNMASRSGPAAAYAQPAYSDPDAGGLISAAEQRKVIISELRNIAGRLERIESQVAGGISVKVTDMPPMQAGSERNDRQERRRDDADRNDNRPEPRVEIKPSARPTKAEPKAEPKSEPAAAPGN